MPRFPGIILLSALFAALFGAHAHAQKKTVCTITVNSPDEKDTFRARLPKDQYEFVELIEKGRPDWLRSSCQKGIQCDVIVVSGHFNAGDTFYSDNLQKDDHLGVDELERASCSGSCPALFSRLKEVYLFGCESLNPDASKYASSYGESGRDRMRRIFAGVPVIYGFSSSAPVGPTAGMLINRYFDGGGGPIGSGRTNSRLLSVFARNSMVTTRGVAEGESQQRQRVCQFYDERLTAAKKLRMIHSMMKRDMREARGYFARIESLMGSLIEAQRQDPSFTQALAEISADDGARDQYLALARDARQPAMRARMISLAANLGWLSPAGQRTETIAMVNDVLASNAMGFAEVDLICSLNGDRQLDGDLARVKAPSRSKATTAAALACLGDREAHGQVLRALASPDEKDVQVAQAYLLHRPISDSSELRDVAKVVARMPSSGAKVRALDALGRLNIKDGAVLRELVQAFADATSAAVQRAIAEIFIRSDTKAIAVPSVVAVLQRNRLKAPATGEDLIDKVIRRLQAETPANVAIANVGTS